MKTEQIEQWAQSPVNEVLIKAITRHLEELRVGTDAYHPFEPYKTQEIMAGLNGSIETWEIVVGLLQGDWDFLEDYDE